MRLLSLDLQNFRSYSRKQFDFNQGLTVIVGPNTSGKTNILEAIFYLSTGKSFRAREESEAISYQEKIARISAEVEKEESRDKLEIVLIRGEFYGKRTLLRKRYFVNGVSRRMIDFVGKLKLSLFWPEDLELVTDSPSIRRHYLDFVLMQIDRNYLRASRNYEQALRQRNRLLENIREGRGRRDELSFWDKLLIENGDYLHKARSDFLDFLNRQNLSFDGCSFRVFYDHSLISKERLFKYKEEEIAAGATLVGPHRDEFKLKIKNEKLKINGEKDLALYGSRGEQRLGVLWLKLGELVFIKEKSEGEAPLLLLDDIFSEFDRKNRQLIFEHIGNQQTIITTTDMQLIEKKLKEQAEIIQLK